ncbi:maleate isomerase [Halogranum gelatinilyticum]|uniref:Maleate isomerase n=1 Tax=Halogranum gelatinilyticum TaxID=660521 RepID=A0A1G9NYE9_9EURY|nr:maleate isomerase [Halogranum gelatinilyticum]
MTPPDPTHHGERLRLGVVVPSSNTTVEPEFAGWTPADVSVHAARMPLVDVTVEGLDAMADDAADAAARLGDAEVDAVAYACTTGSLVHGHGFDAELETRLADAAGVPAVATALSVRRLLDALDATRLAVATPYVAELNEREREYLAEAGFDVVRLDGRGIERNTDIGRLTPSDARRRRPVRLVYELSDARRCRRASRPASGGHEQPRDALGPLSGDRSR